MYRQTRRGGVGTCVGTRPNGKVCGSKCPGKERCKTHERMYLRDNPDTKLQPTDTQQTKDVLEILNKMREPDGMKRLEQGFVVMLVSREVFPPSENVNKFVTGGIAEDVIADVIQNLGFSTQNVAATSTLIDIEVNIGGRIVGISLKNSGGIDQQPILENYRGDSRSDVRKLPPTLIIYTETKVKRARIVFIDHDILRQAFPPELTDEEFNTKVYNISKENKQASLTFRAGILKSFIPKLPDAYIVNVKFPDRIPKVEKKSITLLALEFVRTAMATAHEEEEPEEACYDCGNTPATNRGDDGHYYCDACWNGEEEE